MGRLASCLAWVLPVLIVAGCAGSGSRLKLGKNDQGEVVEAEGFAPYDAKDLINTKRGSLVDAQRNAVEKVVGVFVSAKTLVEKAVAIENNILARTDGYLKKYDVMSEGVENNLYKTKIRALVALKDLEADLKQFSLLKTPELQRPRVAIELVEEADKAAMTEAVARNTLQKSLIDQGFIIMEGEQAKQADLLIKGKASAYPFQSEGLGGFVSYRARISLQVVRPDTGAMVTSYSKEASGLGGSNELASFKALETVGNLAGSEMGATLTESVAKGKALLVFVEGVKSFAEVDRVKKHLASQPGVTDLMLRLYDEDMAQFDVQLGNVQPAELASRLENSQSLPLKVLEAKPQTLRLRMN